MDSWGEAVGRTFPPTPSFLKPPRTSLNMSFGIFADCVHWIPHSCQTTRSRLKKKQVVLKEVLPIKGKTRLWRPLKGMQHLSGNTLWSAIGTSNRNTLDTLNIDEVFAEPPLEVKDSLSTRRKKQQHVSFKDTTGVLISRVFKARESISNQGKGVCPI